MRWPTQPIGELATFHGGGTPSRSKAEFYDGDVPWVTPKDMKRWRIRDSQVKLTAAGLAASPAKILPAESVLVVVRSGVLKHSLPVAIADVPVSVNQDLKALVARPGVEPRYLAHLVKASDRVVLSWVRATTADNFPVEKLKELGIPLPPIEEQRRIADILDHADALRAKRREALGLLDDLTQSTFVEMFGDLSSSRFVTKLGDVVRPATGSTPSRSTTQNFGGSIPWVKTGEVVGGVITSTEETVTEKGQGGARLRLYPKNSIVIALYGQGRTRGQCAMLGIPATTNQACAVLPPGDYDSWFMFVQLRLAYERLRALARGGNQPNLNLQLVGSLPVIVPPLKEQREFATRSAAIERQRARSAEQLASIECLFSAAQHRASAGLL